jgi:hypothetical protein
MTDPGTSFQAASSVENVTTTQGFILRVLRKKALCDVDLINAYRAYKTAPVASESGIRSRRAELVEQGLVEDSGRRVKLASGRNAIVWQVA